MFICIIASLSIFAKPDHQIRGTLNPGTSRHNQDFREAISKKVIHSSDIPSVPRYFKQPISANFRQCSFHNQKRAKQIGTIFVVSLIAKKRKITCVNSTAGSVR